MQSDAEIQEADTPRDAAPAPPGPCDVLFGNPSETTGLSSEWCQPRCSCGDTPFEPPNYPPEDTAAWSDWTLLNPMTAPDVNPYETPERYPLQEGAVCGFLIDDASERTYRLQTFANESEASGAGAQITHNGGCGLCSSLQDLRVYTDNGDLTEPVRACGLEGLRGGSAEENIVCLQTLGFTRSCAEIWYYNTLHTRENCLTECVTALGQPYHQADGRPNACILCDETQSGPVFKAVAGRTRRNSGLPSALCRPCDTVARIVHRYPADS